MAKVIQRFAHRTSRRIAKYEVKKHSRRSPDAAFSASWTHLLSHPLYRLCIWLGENPVRESTQLKGRTFELLWAAIPDYRSASVAISDNLREAIEAGRPFLAVHIHDGCYPFVSRAFTERGRDLTRIVANPATYIRQLRDLGVDVSRIHTVNDNVLSLVRLRKAIRANHVICCAIDYRNANRRRAYINPAVFGFARLNSIPVYFVKSHVLENGCAELISAGPYAAINPMDCAKQFLDFFNSVGESRVALKIKRYNEHWDWRKYTKQRPEKAESPSSLPID